MRLLFFSPHYGTPGGVRLVIDAIAAVARAAGHEVAAITDAGAPPGMTANEHVRLYPFPEQARDWRRLRRFTRKFPTGTVRLLRATRRLRPDVVHAHCVRTFGPYVLALRRLSRIPHVVTLHEGALPPDVPQHEMLFRLLVRAGDVVTAVSREGADYAMRVGGARRVRVLPNGFDPAEFDGVPAYEHPRPYVLGLGRLELQKGFDVLIEAVARLARMDVDLILVGDGAERARLAERAHAGGLGARLHLLGTVERTRTVALLRGAAVVACPSRWEGLPLVLLEALAAGRPVVASDVNGIPEVVHDGKTGVLVPPDDPAALADALARVLVRPADAAALGARGRALVETEHRWAVAAPRYLAAFDEAARG